jgi:serine/threonine-protein kinase
VTIADRIAVGMSADVFTVWHHALLTPLVCKRVRPADADHAAHRRRLRLEGHALSLMAHPGIVRLVDQRHDVRLPYLLLEHVEGRTLRQILKTDGPLEAGAAVRIVQHVAAGVAHLHARGFLHRDLKPSNIVLRAGRPVLLDFGVVWRLAPGRRPPDRSGTAQYLTPEQIAREPLTPATDVWGLGILLYELLRGDRPFPTGPQSAETPLTERYPQLTQSPPLLASVPGPLARVVDACLERRPRDRPRTAVELARALDRFTETKVWPSHVGGAFEPFGRRTAPRRHHAA